MYREGLDIRHIVNIHVLGQASQQVWVYQLPLTELFKSRGNTLAPTGRPCIAGGVACAVLGKSCAGLKASDREGWGASRREGA